MARGKKEISAKRGLTMVEAHARIDELKPKLRIEAKVLGKAAPANGITKSAGRKSGR
jgi:hypothetical protein